jgi:hypothetical protein
VSEPYVRPPLLAREPLPRWVEVWRFRAALLLVLLAAFVVLLLAYRQVTGANDQDPGLQALVAALPPLR